MNSKKLVLIDSYAIIYRSYYAFISRPIFSPKGINTSSIYGYLLAIDEALNKHKPTHIAAAFDTSAPTFRHIIYPEYKANREKTPEDIRVAVPIIKDLLRCLNIQIIEKDGFEADDIIGTIAKKAEDLGYEVIIVTPDKDFAQLVNKNIKLFRPKKSTSDSEIWGIEEVKKNFEVDYPNQVIDILALWGDTADNIPGVKGIGEVTAKKLIAQYKSIENILDHIGELKPSYAKLIEESKNILNLSKQLVRIETNAPIDFNETEFVVKKPNYSELKQILEELNFKSFINKFIENNSSINQVAKQRSLFDNEENTTVIKDTTSANIKNTPHEYNVLKDTNKITEFINNVKQTKEFCFDTESTGLSPHTDYLIGVSFSNKPFSGFYLPLPDNITEAKTILSPFKEIFEDENIIKIGHNLKFDILFINRYDIEVKGMLFDTMLAHYLIQPEQNHKLDNLSLKYLQYTPIPIEQLIGKKGAGQLNMKQIPIDIVCEYSCEDADVTIRIKPLLEKELEKYNLTSLFYEVEAKLLKVLIAMERNGFPVDIEYLKKYKTQLEEELKSIENDIYNQAGQRFNIQSPRQLGEILFENLKIPYDAKLTKTKQYSTNEEILQQLKDKHPIINLILDYRGISKLLSTYVEALPRMVNPNTGKIHTSFNQTLTVTGRLSSNNPNLQNIPIKDEKGREIRKAFIPSEGNILLSADYSQIELRIMAHMSGDENMIQAFLEDQDIHTATASKVFKLPINQVTKELRNKAKTANFGIIYGISAFGLSQRMNIPRKEANDLITEYFKTFPGIKKYMSEMILFAKENGYVETILKRRRYLPDIHSQNAVVRGMAERNAINSPIQGSAADIIKLAMIRICEEFYVRQLKSKMILQVHDELIFDVFPDELDIVKTIVKEKMENAYKMSVPLKVDIGTGENWLEAH